MLLARAANLEFKIPNPYNLELFDSVWNSKFGLEFSLLFGTFQKSLEFSRYFGIFSKMFDRLSKSLIFFTLGHIKSVTRQLILCDITRGDLLLVTRSMQCPQPISPYLIPAVVLSTTSDFPISDRLQYFYETMGFYA